MNALNEVGYIFVLVCHKNNTLRISSQACLSFPEYLRIIIENETLEDVMMYVVLWFLIGAAYLLSMILICRCMNLGDKKYVKVVPSQINRRQPIP